MVGTEPRPTFLLPPRTYHALSGVQNVHGFLGEHHNGLHRRGVGGRQQAPVARPGLATPVANTGEGWVHFLAGAVSHSSTPTPSPTPHGATHLQLTLDVTHKGLQGALQGHIGRTASALEVDQHWLGGGGVLERRVVGFVVVKGGAGLTYKLPSDGAPPESPPPPSPPRAPSRLARPRRCLPWPVLPNGCVVFAVCAWVGWRSGPAWGGGSMRSTTPHPAWVDHIERALFPLTLTKASRPGQPLPPAALPLSAASA